MNYIVLNASLHVMDVFVVWESLVLAQLRYTQDSILLNSLIRNDATNDKVIIGSNNWRKRPI